MITAGPLSSWSCSVAGIHSESSTGLRAGGCPDRCSANNATSNPAARITANTHGRKRCQEGVQAPEERCVAPAAAAASAASEISERRLEDAWAAEPCVNPRDEPAVEFDSLPDPS